MSTNNHTNFPLYLSPSLSLNLSLRPKLNSLSLPWQLVCPTFPLIPTILILSIDAQHL